MLLREGVSEEEVSEFAAGLGLPCRVDTPADEEEWVPRQKIWHSGEGVVLAYREDLSTGLDYVVVMAEEADEVETTVPSVELALRTWKISELIDRFDRSEDREDLVDAVLMMGLGAPPEFDERIFSRICSAVRSSDSEVVGAGLHAITNEPWREYADVVGDVLGKGLPPDLEETARRMLVQFGDTGGGS